MKKFLIVIIVLVIMSGLVYAKLSDETINKVEDLRMKHYFYTKYDITCLDSTDYMSVTSSDFEYEHEWVPFIFFTIEDDKLFVKTQDGKEWFIEMKKVIE